MLNSVGIGKIKPILSILAILLVVTAGILLLNNFNKEPNATINEVNGDLQINIDQTTTANPNSDQQYVDDPSIEQNQYSPSDSGTTSSPTTPPSTPENSYDINNKDMIDIVSSSIERDQTNLKVTIQVKDPTGTLSNQELAEFEIIAILENQEDVLQTYELIVNINSSGTFCIVQDVQTKTQLPAQLSSEGDTILITATLSELGDATQVEWNILSTYEVVVNNQVIFSANDFVPDEGLKTTIFTEG